MKQRKPWIMTLALVGILALLAAYVFLVESKREPPPEEGAQPTPAPLWEFGGGDVTKITVTRGEQTTAVERDAGDVEWRMTAPEEREADSARLTGLVYRVASAKFTRAMADVGDVAAFGLQEPEVQVTLVLSDGTTINAGLGAENPRGTARYLQQEGDPLVYLVAIGDVDGLLRLLDEPPYPPTPTAVSSPTPSPSPVETPTAEPSLAPTEPQAETPEPTATPPPRPTPTAEPSPAPTEPEAETPTATPPPRPTPAPPS